MELSKFLESIKRQAPGDLFLDHDTMEAFKGSVYRLMNQGDHRRIDFIMTETHWLDHGLPIYYAIPVEYRGRIFTTPELKNNKRIDGEVITINRTTDMKPYGNDRLTVVMSYTDNKIAIANNRAVVFCEHGIGYSFNNGHQSYCGSRKGRENVLAFLCQNEYVFNKNKEAFPNKLSMITGIPKMDKYVGREYPINRENPTVCISFHWDATVHPMTRSAYRFYLTELENLKKHFKVIGHGHPRILPKLEKVYERYDIETVWDFDEVLERADVYINDSSSTPYEFMFLDKPAILLNCQYYDKALSINSRFWEYADAAVQVDSKVELIDAVKLAAEDPPEQKAKRREAIKAIFSFLDGKCAERAAMGVLLTAHLYKMLKLSDEWYDKIIKDHKIKWLSEGMEGVDGILAKK